ncbi:MAG: lamin tail domain-containing protein [bacterium]
MKKKNLYKFSLFLFFACLLGAMPAAAAFSKTEIKGTLKGTVLASDVYNGNDVSINEFVSDPADGGGEWIELYNNTNKIIDLAGWTIEDGTAKKTILSGTISESGASRYFVVEKPKGSLNNAGDLIILRDTSGKIIDRVVYGDWNDGSASNNAPIARAPSSLAKKYDGQNTGNNKNDFFVALKPTKGAKNIFVMENSEAVADEANSERDEEYLSPDEVENYLGDYNYNGQIITAGADYYEVELADVKRLEIGDYVKTRGIVAVLPGIFGVQYFYIVSGEGGVQVYNYNKDFPEMEIGSLVEILGEISESGGEKRIKTKYLEDIEVFGKTSPPEPVDLECGEINDEVVGQLVRVFGEIIDKKGTSFFVDDGTEKLEVQIKTKTNINLSSLIDGMIVSVAGIVSKTKSGLRLLPRSGEDIILESEDGISDKESVSAEEKMGDEINIPARNKKILLGYFIVLLIGGVVLVGDWWWKKFKKEKPL